MNPSRMNKAVSSRPSVTFLLCAESGYFEGQTLLAIECLRRFGGRFADAPVLVVTPRFGPSLDPTTLRRFDELGARYIYSNARNGCSWYVYMNKALAVSVADELVESDQVIWLDSDVLVISEPTPLLLDSNEDFACCSIDKNVGTSGPNDPNNNYWVALGRKYGIPLEALPWVETEYDKQQVRFRLHSGVYAFKVGAGLGRAFVSDMETMLTCGTAYSRKMPFPGDDVALAFSVVRRGLRWRQLPMSCNFEMTRTSNTYSRAAAQQAAVLHFHKALDMPVEREWFLQELETFRPDVAEWLRGRLPIPKKGWIGNFAMRRFLYELRTYRQKQQAKLCDFFA